MYITCSTSVVFSCKTRLFNMFSKALIHSLLWVSFCDEFSVCNLKEAIQLHITYLYVYTVQMWLVWTVQVWLVCTVQVWVICTVL